MESRTTRADRLRPLVRAALKAFPSQRKAAEDVGVSHTALNKFLGGETPYDPTLDKYEVWLGGLASGIGGAGSAAGAVKERTEGYAGGSGWEPTELDDAERWLSTVADPELRARWTGTPDFVDNMLAASDIVSRRTWPTERKLAVQALIHRLIQNEAQGER